MPNVPVGWPTTVPPRGIDGWERWAVSFLFDCCPPDYRRHAVLRRHPVVLAGFARRFVTAAQAAATRDLTELRSELIDVLPPPALEEAIEAWHSEIAVLARTSRAVRLVEDALRADVSP